MGAGNALGRAAVAAVLLLGGCSGGREAREGGQAAEREAVAGEPPAPPGEVRREFVVLRELAKQHGIQGEAGNAARVEAVERHLRERLAEVPDEGRNEEERGILERARRAMGE